jgi:signal peptidase I
VSGTSSNSGKIGGKGKAKESDDTVEGFRETAISIAIALIFAFSFRIFVVEAFVIPTGSMAPTLLGEHIGVQCTQCGYRYNVDVPEKDRLGKRSTTGESVEVVCPMCHARRTVPGGTAFAAGDRILVQKFAYAVQEPKRYDVVVFKNPEDPQISYIKRLVGLPEEELMVLEGNIYTRQGGATQGGAGQAGATQGGAAQAGIKQEGAASEAGDEYEGFKIARKTDRLEVQRCLWRPLSKSQYTPLDAGLTGNFRDINPWKAPWVPTTSAQGWKIHEVDGATGIPSRQIVRTSPESGTMAFDFEAAIGSGPGLGPYNQLKYRGGDRTYGLGQDRIEELRFCADVTCAAGKMEMEISTTARVLPNPMAPASRLTAKFGADGAVELVQTDFHPKAIDGPDAQAEDRSIQAGDVAATTTLEKGKGKGFGADKTSRVELWYCDDEAIVWQDGEPILRHKFEIPIKTALHRWAPPKYPKLEVTLAGDVAVLERVCVDRDMYYVDGPPGGTGVVAKDEAGNVQGHPVKIEKDQFFCMGDNSAFSHDGRFWQKVDPWVKGRFFTGHQQQIGIVPRELLMGRAFYVYYPAPYSLVPSREAEGLNMSLLPNFQDMRVIK